mmetsp:Transcript_14232/g.42997  ORF Transcript_14232/g.42997 Transcript_14232/m.42997 type:complete len:239 (+) Transcript_14232:375-1091(+)
MAWQYAVPDGVLRSRRVCRDLVRKCLPGMAPCHNADCNACPLYSSEIFAPTASSFFWSSSASSFFTPDLMTAGAFSTSSLASLRPSVVMERTSLMTFTLAAASKPVSLMSNSVFSSAGTADSTGAAAAAGAAAGIIAPPMPIMGMPVTPSRFLRISVRSVTSSIDMLKISSDNLFTLSEARPITSRFSSPSSSNAEKPRDPLGLPSRARAAAAACGGAPAPLPAPLSQPVLVAVDKHL